jgi:uncharacterized Zn-finger protein
MDIDSNQNLIHQCNELILSIERKSKVLSNVSNLRVANKDFNEKIKLNYKSLMSENDDKKIEDIFSKYCEEEKDKCLLSNRNAFLTISCENLGNNEGNAGQNSIREDKFDSFIETTSFFHKLQFQCKLCPFSVFMKKDLKSHILEKHINEKVFNCDYCSYQTTVYKRLVRHLDICHNNDHCLEKPFKCDWNECKMSFISLSNMREHLSMHTLLCKLCNKGFKSNSQLSRHLKTHNRATDSRKENGSEKHFKCEYCSSNFNWKKNLISHLRSKHSDLIRPHLNDKFSEQNFKLLNCKFCDQKFVFLSKLRRHENMHTRNKPFQCNKCSYKTAYKQHLLRHQKQHEKKNYIGFKENKLSNLVYKSNQQYMIKTTGSEGINLLLL